MQVTALSQATAVFWCMSGLLVGTMGRGGGPCGAVGLCSSSLAAGTVSIPDWSELLAQSLCHARCLLCRDCSWPCSL